MASIGSAASAAFTSIVNCLGVGTFISTRSTLGGVARAVGARSIHPHLTA